MTIKRQRTFSVPFGKGHMHFDLPPRMRGTLAESRPSRPLAFIEKAISLAVQNPINSPLLRELARPGDKACIVFTDMTRSSPDHLLVPPLLAELKEAGLHESDITLLCGVGMHRPSRLEEKVVKLGRAVVERYRVIDHEPQNPAALVDLGTTAGGIPLSINRIAHEADLLIATGVVEPHQYAGYSGGRKSVSIGAAGEAMIACTHGPHMLDHPGTRLGKIEGNAFHEAVTEAARRVGLCFIVNVVQDDQGRPVTVLAGEPEQTFEALVNAARRIYEVPIDRQYDVAVAGVGFPKDANIYQASRAPSYLFFAPTSVVKEGGVFIVPASTPEGAGEGVGEKRFFEEMHAATDMPSLVVGLRKRGYPPGAQRAYVMGKVMEKTQVIFVGSRTPQVVRQVHMIPAADMEEAFRMAAEKMGRKDLDVLIVPHALRTLPIVGKA